MSHAEPKRVAIGAVGAVVIVALTLLALKKRLEHKQTCPEGLQPSAHGCCPPGQKHGGGSCVGKPSSCPPELTLVTDPHPACVLLSRVVTVAGGSLQLGPQDWDGRPVKARTITIDSFRMDTSEVTVLRWQRCVTAKKCPELAHSFSGQSPLGQSVRAVSPKQAAAFCAFAGGRLPTDDEWTFAAAGTDGRKFPWGPSGLVCRRAAFGLVEGPCRHHATAPDLAGTRPDGKSPDGLFDLSGNVAEWTIGPQDTYFARGGSFRSRAASQLKSWSGFGASEAAEDIGFRCAY